MERKEKECNVHGTTTFFKRPDGGWRCAKCNTAAVTNRRKKLKEQAVKFKGGKCCKCGYDKCNGALEFHHEGNKVDFSNSIYGKSWERIKVALKECILVCSNCHREIHYYE